PRRLMREVASVALQLVVCPLQEGDRLAASVAPRLATRSAPLGFPAAGPSRPAGSGAAAPPTGPSAVRRTPVPPTSMPVSCPVGGSGGIGSSAQEQQPRSSSPGAAVGLVADGDGLGSWVLGLPASGRDQRGATRPILERPRKPWSSMAPLLPT